MVNRAWFFGVTAALLFSGLAIGAENSCPEFPSDPISPPQFAAVATELERFIADPDRAKVPAADTEGTSMATMKIPASPLSSEVFSFVDTVSKTLFGGGNTLRIDECMDETCEGGFAMVNDARHVILYSKAIVDLATANSSSDADRDELIKLIITHEISHFIYEKELLARPKRPSVLGNATLNVFDPPLPKPGKHADDPEYRADSASYYLRHARAHSEVDFIALAVMRKIDGKIASSRLGANFMALTEGAYRKIQLPLKMDAYARYGMCLSKAEDRFRASRINAFLSSP